MVGGVLAQRLDLFHRALGSHPPNMGIVPSVEHRASGERVEHREYDRLFQAIKRRVPRAAPTPWASRRASNSAAGTAVMPSRPEVAAALAMCWLPRHNSPVGISRRDPRLRG